MENDSDDHPNMGEDFCRPSQVISQKTIPSPATSIEPKWQKPARGPGSVSALPPFFGSLLDREVSRVENGAHVADKNIGRFPAFIAGKVKQGDKGIREDKDHRKAMARIDRGSLKSSVIGYHFLPRRDPEVIEMRSGGGCISVFGLPFLLAGLFIMQIPLGLVPVGNSDSLPWFFFPLFGGVFVAVGVFLVFGRSGLILDRRQKRIIQWRGLLVPMERKEQLLDEVKKIVVEHDSGDSDSGVSYPVKLEGDRLNTVRIFAPSDYQEARLAAEELARFLSRPVEDFSAGLRIVRDPDKLDESLRERIRRTKEDTGYQPVPPLPMKTQVQETTEGLILEIPGPGITIVHWIQMGMVFVFVGFALYFFLGFWRLPSPPFVRALFGGFLLVFLILGPLLGVLWHVRREARKLTVVTVSRAFLRVEERSGRKSRITEIPADELEELVLPTGKDVTGSLRIADKFSIHDLPESGVPRLPDGRPMPKILVTLMKLAKSPGMTARSDTTSVQLGSGLPEDELKYLHALIKKILTRR